MQVILIKYLQVFCFALFLSNNISCDTTLVGKKQSDNELYKLSICTARCMEKASTLTLEKCYKMCNEPLTEKIKEIRQIYENLEVKFICRDATSFVLEIVKGPYDTIINMRSKDDFKNPSIYIFKISEANHSVPASKYVYLTDSQIIEIQNLTSNTLYNISASVVHTNGEYSVIAKEVQFSTLEKNYKPEKIYDVDVSRYKVEENNKNYLSAVITWKPAKDMTCYYEILCYSSVVEADFEIVQKEVKAPKTLFSYKVENLTFGTEYHIGVRGKNPRDTVNESDMIWHNVTTPTCLQWYQNNLTICPPNVPEELNVTATFLNVNVFSMNLTWKKLFPEPDYYIIKVLDLNRFVTNEPNSITINVSKEFTSYYLPTVTLYGFQCEVHLIAVSPGGNSTATITNILERHIDITGVRTMKLVAAIMTPIMFIVIFSLVILIICHRRAKLRRYQERCKYFEDLEKKAPVDPNSNFEFNSKNFSVISSVDSLTLKQDLEKFFINDEMEICRTDVQLFEILGEGAFGLVRRGIVRTKDDTKSEVAVKMLKDHPSNDDITAFRREIDVMKSVGQHPNIVSIIGHCTKNINEMLLLTEYCSLGNLLNFLRTEWKYLNNINLQKNCCTPESQKQDENIFNFDTSIMDKTSFKYKNIDDNKTEQQDHITCSIDIDGDLKTNIVINKAYDYNSCTNSCKCKVDIISKVCLKETDTGPLEPISEVKIQNCDCNIRTANSEVTSPLLVENKSYYKFLKTKDKKNLSIEQPVRQALKSTDLLHIAKHIAMGMEFLSKNKVVHRDLAARNVLVCKDRTVKIADFGLSRDVYQENIYKKTGNGKLPIKWLALESMTHQVYTSQSDVWSFGILLYEIVTLGGTPYPLIPTSRLLKLLKAGYRMERPKNCGQTLYNLMLSCWHVNPHDRPTFTEICKIIDDILMSSPDEYIINFCFSESDKGSKSISDESYLKPI